MLLSRFLPFFFFLFLCCCVINTAKADKSLPPPGLADTPPTPVAEPRSFASVHSSSSFSSSSQLSTEGRASSSSSSCQKRARSCVRANNLTCLGSQLSYNYVSFQQYHLIMLNRIRAINLLYFVGLFRFDWARIPVGDAARASALANSSPPIRA